MAARAAWKSPRTMGRTLSAETVLTRGPNSLQMHPSLVQEKWQAAGSGKAHGEVSQVMMHASCGTAICLVCCPDQYDHRDKTNEAKVQAT